MPRTIIRPFTHSAFCKAINLPWPYQLPSSIFQNCVQNLKKGKAEYHVIIKGTCSLCTSCGLQRGLPESDPDRLHLEHPLQSANGVGERKDVLATCSGNCGKNQTCQAIQVPFALFHISGVIHSLVLHS